MASINCINNIVTNNDFDVGNTLASNVGSVVYLRKNRTGGVITTGDNLGSIVFTGYDGASNLVTSQITCTSSGTIAATRIGSNLKFYTHADSVVASKLRLTIADTGALTIAAPDSGVALTITGGGQTITAGGLTVTAGGIRVTAGGITIDAGGLTVTTGTTTLTDFATAGMVINNAFGDLSTANTTQFCVQVGNATGALSSLGVGTANQLLHSSGAGVNPTWTTTTYPLTTTKGDLLHASADNTITVLAKSVLSTRYLANTGVDNLPKWDQVNLTTGVVGALPITNGGTNAISMSDTYGVNYFNGTSLVTTTVGTANQLLHSSGAGVAPTWTTNSYPLTSVKGDLLYASANNTLTTLAKNALATRYLANTGVDNIPQWDQIDVATGITGVLSIANGGTNTSAMTNVDGVCYYDGTRVSTTTAGTATYVLTSNGAGVAPTFQASTTGVLPWQSKNANFNIDINTGYMCTSGSTIDGTLPAIAASGAIIRVAAVYEGGSSGGVNIKQNAGQYIYSQVGKSSVGVGGKIAITKGETVELVCVIANTSFMVLSQIGTILWT